jgi:hypothetical protein
MCLCIYVFVYLCVCVFMCLCICVFMCLCIYVFVYIMDTKLAINMIQYNMDII